MKDFALDPQRKDQEELEHTPVTQSGLPFDA